MNQSLVLMLFDAEFMESSSKDLPIKIYESVLGAQGLHFKQEPQVLIKTEESERIGLDTVIKSRNVSSDSKGIESSPRMFFFKKNSI
jgi:hypothetical protein